MKKTELRTLYKHKRNQFSLFEIQENSMKILENLKKMPIWEKSSYHIYIPIEKQKEINTYLIINYLFSLHKSVIVPKIEGDKMKNCKIGRNVEWNLGKFDIPEPKSFQLVHNDVIEVVFVPMLICDQSGNRVGYGGGFYDRFFHALKQDVLKIGLNYFSPIAKISDVESTDVPLDYCVTSNEIVSFSS